MSTVDTRIVVLQFDNKDFESNVETSIESLARLKKETNFAESAKGMDQLSASAKKFDLSSIGDACDAVVDKFSFLGTIGDQILRNLTNSAVDFAKNLITMVPNLIKSGGMKRALNIEHAMFQIEGLGAKWDDIKDDINYAVEGTAYGLDEAAVAASQLLASGVEFGKVFGTTGNSPMAKALRGISGVAAMTGAQYPEISRIFAAIAGNGRVMGQQLTQLGQRGLPAAAKMAEFFNNVRAGSVEASDSVKAFIMEMTDGMEDVDKVTESMIREMVSDKDITVSFEVFSEAMDSAFGEHAKEANKTYSGSLDNLRAAFSRLGATYIQDKLKSQRNLFNALRLAVNGVHTALKPVLTIAAGVRKWITDKLIDRLLGFIHAINTDEIKEWSAKATAKWRAFFRLDEADNDLASMEDRLKNWGTKWKNFFTGEEKAADGAEKVTEAVAGTKKAYESLDALAWTVIKGDYGIYTERYNKLEAEGYAWQVVQNRVNELLGCQKRHAHTNEDVERTLRALGATTIETTEAIVQEGDATRLTTKELDEKAKYNRTLYTSLQKYFGKTYEEIRNMADRGQIHVEAFNSAVRGETRITKEHLRQAVLYTGHQLDEFAAYLGTTEDVLFGLADAGRLSKESIQAIADEMDAATTKAEKRQKVLATLKDLLHGIVSFAQLIGKFVVSVAKGVWPLLKEIGGLIKDVVLLIVDGFAALGRWIGGVKEAADATDVWTKITEGLQRVLTPVVNVVKWLRDGVQHLVENIKILWGKLKETEGFKRLKEELVFVKEILKEVLGKIWDKIKKAFGYAGDALSDAKKHLPTLDDVANFIGRIAGAIATFIHNIRTGEGKVGAFFSTIKNFFTAAGGRIKGVVQWFIDNKDKIIDFFKNLKNTPVGQIFIKIKDWIVNDTKEFFANLDVQKIVDTVKNFFNRVGDALSTVDWTKVFEFVTNLLKVVLMWQLIKSVVDNLKSSSRMMDSISGFFGALTKRIKGEQPKVKVFQTIAFSILMLAGAMFIVASIPSDKLIPAGIAIVGLFTLLLIAAVIIGKIGEKAKVGWGTAATFISMALAMLILAGAVAIFAKMNPSTIKEGGIAVMEFLLGMALAARIAGKGGLGIAAMAIGLLLLAPAIAIYARMKVETLRKGGAAVAGLLIAIGIACRIAGGNKAAGTIIAFAIAVDLMAIAVWSLSKLNTASLITATACISGLMLALAGATRLTKSSGKAKEVAATITQLIIPLIAVSAALWFLSQYDSGTLLKTAASIGLVLGAVTASLVVLKKTGPTEKKEIGALYAAILGMGLMLAEVGALFVALKLVGYDESLLPIAEGISLLLGTCAVAFTCLAGVFKLPDGSVMNFGQALKLTIEAILAMAGMMLVGGAITILIGAIAGIADGKGAEIIEKGAEMMGVIGRAIGDFFGGIIGGIVNGTMEGIATGIERIGTALENFTTGFTTFTDAAAKVDQTTVDKIGLMVQAILALTAADLIDGLSRWFSLGTGGTFESIGEGLINLADPIKTFCNSLSDITIDDVTKASDVLKATADLMASAPTSGGIKDSILGTLDLDAFGTQLEVFAPHINAFAGALDGVDADKVSTASHAMAEVIGVLSNNIGFREGGRLQKFLGEFDFAKFGTNLEEFGGHFAAYYDKVQHITKESLEGSSAAAQTIMEFANSAPNEGGWLAKIVGDNTLDKFGPQLLTFGIYFAAYYDHVQHITKESLEGSSAAAQTIMEFADAVPNSGDSFLSALVGDNTLDKFGKELFTFGFYFAKYYDYVKDIKKQTIMGTSAAVRTIAAFASEIPNSGLSVVSVFVGDNTLSDFGEQLAAFGPYFADYYESISGIKSDVVVASADAGKAMVGLAQAIGGNSEVLNWLTGQSNHPMSNLGSDLEGFGEHFKEYYNNISGIDFVTVSRSRVQAEGFLAFMKDASEIQGFNQFTQNLTLLGSPQTGLANAGNNLISFGEDAASFVAAIKDLTVDPFIVMRDATALLVKAINDLDATQSKGGSLYTLGDGIEYYGPRLYDYYASISDIDTTKMSQVTVQTRGIVELVAEAAGLTGAISFADNIYYYGEKLASYGSLVSGIDYVRLNSAINASYDLIDLIHKMKTVTATDSQGFKDALHNAGTTSISGFVAALNGSASTVRVAIATFMINVSNIARGYAYKGSTIYNGFYQAGKYGGIGLEDGLLGRLAEVRKAAIRVGNAATEGVRIGMAEKSPSKETMKAGEFADEGLIIGLLAMMGAVHATAEKVGENTVDAMANPLSTLSDIISGEIDMDPTIRPVLDLSDIQNKSGLISSMIPTGSTYNLSGGTAYAMAGANSRFGSATEQDVLAGLIAAKVGEVMTQAVTDIQNSNENATYMINVPLYIDGKETARVTAPFMRSELDRIDRNNLRKAGTR